MDGTCNRIGIDDRTVCTSVDTVRVFVDGLENWFGWRCSGYVLVKAYRLPGCGRVGGWLACWSSVWLTGGTFGGRFVCRGCMCVCCMAYVINPRVQPPTLITHLAHHFTHNSLSLSLSIWNPLSNLHSLSLSSIYPHKPTLVPSIFIYYHQIYCDVQETRSSNVRQ